MCRDPVYTFSHSNVVGGEFNYTGSRARDRRTVVKVAWDTPVSNGGTELVRDEREITKHGECVLDLSEFACTSQAEAKQVALRALEIEKAVQVSFDIQPDGFIPETGSLISIDDRMAESKRFKVMSTTRNNDMTVRVTALSF
ncbi:phage tail protein [Psychrobacter sanguinis]|uniref:phage tail protein n=1 Tax=Psychrobacter sanguinis TaxID=861445 RepID=UPI001919BF59|nr:phage tail protein [Psychrobacter sanguinis]MCC3344869.1 phage tail protein [Psychrobacter sanguinis]